MSESGRLSETSESVDEEEEYSDDDEYSEGSEYTESGEDSDDEDQGDEVAEDYSDLEGSPVLVQRKTAAGKLAAAAAADSFYEEREGLLPLRSAEGPQDYPPDRWPPLLDFLFVFSSFVAAVVAAYFTLF